MQDILLKTWLLLMSLFCGNCFSTYVHHCCCIVIGVTVLTCFALHWMPHFSWNLCCCCRIQVLLLWLFLEFLQPLIELRSLMLRTIPKLPTKAPSVPWGRLYSQHSDVSICKMQKSKALVVFSFLLLLFAVVCSLLFDFQPNVVALIFTWHSITSTKQPHIELRDTTFSIGRSQKCGLTLRDNGISQELCRIRYSVRIGVVIIDFSISIVVWHFHFHLCISITKTKLSLRAEATAEFCRSTKGPSRRATSFLFEMETKWKLQRTRLILSYLKFLFFGYFPRSRCVARKVVVLLLVAGL